MKRLVRQSFRVAGAFLGAFAVFVLLEIMVQAFGGGSHYFANWAVVRMEKIFRPVGHWFVSAPDWAWISVTMVLGFPMSWVLVWSLDVAGIGINKKHIPRWVACTWIIVVSLFCASVRWVRTGSPF